MAWEQSENKPCSVCQWQWRLCLQLWPVHLLLLPTASTTDTHFSLSSLFGEEPHTVFSSHSHLPSWLPGAIYRRTCRSWWTPPKASATRCCFWIFLADFQTAGSETDQKQPSETVKGACSLVILKNLFICFMWPVCKWKCFDWLDILFYCWAVLYGFGLGFFLQLGTSENSKVLH